MTSGLRCLKIVVERVVVADRRGEFANLLAPNLIGVSKSNVRPMKSRLIAMYYIPPS